MVVLIVVLGALAWVAFDYMQSHALKNLFYAHLFERLKQQATEDRISFNKYIKEHYQLVTLFFTQKNYSNYIEKQRWSAEDAIQVKYHHRPPEWFPPASILRTFVKPHYVLLLDAHSRVREVYSHMRTPSSSLLQPSSLLLAKSRGQSFLVNNEGAPYVVASEPYMDSQGRLRATLIVASPINDEFLLVSTDSSDPGHAVALVAPEEDPQDLKVQVSSNLKEIPPGSSLKELRGRYLVTGEEFFDYGASDIYIRLVSFISAEEVKSLTRSVISSQQKQRLYAAPVFILAFVLIMFWVTKRIGRLTQRVIDFSQNKLGVKQEMIEKGDELHVLESRFQHLTEDVLQSREALIRESERRIALERRHLKVKQKERELNLLHSVTEAIGVGVMVKNNDELQPANKPMKNFADMCGGLSVFDIKDATTSEISLLDTDGERRTFDISTPKIFEEEKIYLVQDVTEIKAHTEALEYMALHDALTGLPNRILFYDRLKQSILARQRERRSLVLMMIDLDRFKEINDTLGHHAGDMVLKEIGTRLHGALRQSDTISRFGGDEFAVLLPVSDLKDAEQVTSRMLDETKQPIIVDGNNLYVRISIGIALYPVHGEDADSLVKHADMAMYTAKSAQSGASVYSPEQKYVSEHRVVLMSELERAIEEDKELTLYYQPKISHKTGSISGVEALVRWLHPQQGLILPDSFIPLTERAGLIKSLTTWILNNAIRQCAEWHQRGIKIGVAVNLSSLSLQDLNFPEQVLGILKTWEVEPAWLELEINESAMMIDHTRSMKILTGLNEMGVKLSVDHFGAGYSSLAYIKKLPMDEIKIFRSFVINMEKDVSDTIIVRSIIDLAHNLALKVIAVGIESKQVMESLERLSCDELQGNYICPPLPAEELMRWLNESKWRVNPNPQAPNNK